MINIIGKGTFGKVFILRILIFNRCIWYKIAILNSSTP